jgi:hypothetical protein
MSIHFKLVGIENYNKKVLIYEVKKNESDELSFTVNDIFNFIISLIGNKIDDALELEKIKKEFKNNFQELKLIYSSKAINAEEKYNIEKDVVKDVYIFTQNLEIRNKYMDIFEEYGTLLESIKVNELKVKEVEQSKLEKKYHEKLEDESYEDDILTEEQISKSNLDIIELFKNKRFISLFEIYIQEPELFDYFSSYVSCGNIVNEDNEINETDDIKISLEISKDNDIEFCSIQEEQNLGDKKEEPNLGDKKEEQNLGDKKEEQNLGDKKEEQNLGDKKEEGFKYNNSLSSLKKILKDINIEYDDQKLRNLLETYAGFINMPLRHILYNSCNDSN